MIRAVFRVAAAVASTLPCDALKTSFVHTGTKNFWNGVPLFSDQLAVHTSSTCICDSSVSIVVTGPGSVQVFANIERH